MASEDDEEDFYDAQSEASLIKARIVSKYFEFWTRVMKGQAARLSYIDLYCGPGVYRNGAPSTPIIILRKVVEDPVLCQKLVTLFNDVDPEHTEALAKNIYAIPGIERLKFKPQISTGEVDESLADVFARTKMVPSFSFVDPFGYKGVSLKLLHGMLKDWGCDLVLFFSYNRINAALNNAAFEGHVESLFGKQRVERLRQMAKGMSPRKREALVLEEFATAVKERGFEFVLPFTFNRPDTERTSHHLIFVTKNVFPYTVMKEIMAKESSEFEQGVPSFGYAKALSEAETPLLFEFDRPIEDLGAMLLEHYAGRTLSMRGVFEGHHVGKKYIERNYKAALLQLEKEGKVAADPPAAQRKPYKGQPSFGPKVRVTFPRR
jgi:three-Cys-motif partner protein